MKPIEYCTSSAPVPWHEMIREKFSGHMENAGVFVTDVPLILSDRSGNSVSFYFTSIARGVENYHLPHGLFARGTIAAHSGRDIEVDDIIAALSADLKESLDDPNAIPILLSGDKESFQKFGFSVDEDNTHDSSLARIDTAIILMLKTDISHPQRLKELNIEICCLSAAAVSSYFREAMNDDYSLTN